MTSKILCLMAVLLIAGCTTSKPVDRADVMVSVEPPPEIPEWRTIAKAIVDSGFTGYYAHEFIPTRDPMTSLREAVVLCDV